MLLRKNLRNYIINNIKSFGTSNIRLNSKDFYNASGDVIAVQSKPAQAVTSTGAVVGAEFSPRVATGINASTIVGLRGQPLLKGTGSTLTGDFTGFEADLTDNAQAGNTIGGDVVGNRVYMNMAAQTVTGQVVPFKVDAAGSTLQWTHFLKIGEALGDGLTTASDKTGSTKSGTLKVIVDGTLYHIQLYANS